LRGFWRWRVGIVGLVRQDTDQITGRRHVVLLGWPEDDRAENSRLPIRGRERKMPRFKAKASAQKFLTIHAVIDNTFYTAPSPN